MLTSSSPSTDQIPRSICNMCVGENCAPQAVHYMNAQLAALYENAVDCIKQHDWANKPAEQFSTYRTATRT